VDYLTEMIGQAMQVSMLKPPGGPGGGGRQQAAAAALKLEDLLFVLRRDPRDARKLARIRELLQKKVGGCVGGLR